MSAAHVRPRVLVSLPVGTHLHGGNPRGVVDLACRTEDAGADGIVLADHVLLGKHVDKYPWGTFPFPSDAPWLEPLTMLTAIATVTERIKLTTGILIVPLRPAALLAKTAATLDVLSAGRLELGVGTGWQEEELAAQGVDHARRGTILTDYIAACRVLWGASPATFSSPSVSFDEVWSEPKPMHDGRLPVLFSGTLTKRNLTRIVELGDGWIPIMGETVEGIARGIATLRDAYDAAGRSSDDLIVRAPLPLRRGDDGPSLAATFEGSPALGEIGVTDVYLPFTAFVHDEPEVGPWFDELARRMSAA
jgi:probable F420-dependent oxidoreductase